MNPYTITLATLAAVTFLAAGAAAADVVVPVSSPSAQQATDSIPWSLVGGDQKLLKSGGSVKTAKGATDSVALSAANSILSRVCTASPCSWTGAGFPAGDTLLWTSDSGNGGNGPVKITFSSGIAGAGALLQADGPGQFTARIQAFDGSASLAAFTVTSNFHGSPVYVGLLDKTGPHITSVVFSLTAVSQGVTTDFALGTVQLTTKLAAPAVSLSPTSLSFSTQLLKTKSAAKTITLHNSGTATLDISSIASSGEFEQTNKCGKTLAMNASCIVSVTFTPSATGTRTGTITVTDNAPGSPNKVILSGVGSAVKLSTTKLAFASTALNKASASESVTLTNTSSTALGITSISVTGKDAGDFKQSNTCGKSLGVGKSCAVSIAFHPKAKGGRTADLSIADSGGASPQLVVLSGTGK